MANSVGFPEESPGVGEPGTDDVPEKENYSTGTGGRRCRFERIYRRYNRRVSGLCLRMTKIRLMRGPDPGGLLTSLPQRFTLSAENRFLQLVSSIVREYCIDEPAQTEDYGIPLERTMATTRKSPARGTLHPVAQTPH